jgi:hypothetical protein
MRSYLDPLKWGSVRHPTVTPMTPPSGKGPSQHREEGTGSQSSNSAAHLVMSKDDIQRQVFVFPKDCIFPSLCYVCVHVRVRACVCVHVRVRVCVCVCVCVRARFSIHLDWAATLA